MHEFFVALIEYFETLFKRSSALSPENGAAAFFHRLFNIVSQNRISVEEFGYDQPAGDGSNVSDCVLMIMDPWNQRSLRNFLRFKFVDGETVDTYINRWACFHMLLPFHSVSFFIFYHRGGISSYSAANFTTAVQTRSAPVTGPGFFPVLFSVLMCCAVS